MDEFEKLMLYKRVIAFSYTIGSIVLSITFKKQFGSCFLTNTFDFVGLLAGGHLFCLFLFPPADLSQLRLRHL